MLHKFAEAAYTVSLNGTGLQSSSLNGRYLLPACVALCRGHCLMLGEILPCFCAHGFVGKGF